MSPLPDAGLHALLTHGAPSGLPEKCAQCGTAWRYMADETHRAGRALCQTCAQVFDDAGKSRATREPLAEKRALEEAVATFIGEARNDLQAVLHEFVRNDMHAALTAVYALRERVDGLAQAWKAARS